MGYLVAMEIRVTLFLLVQICISYIVQVQSMCVPILRSIGTKLTYAKIMFYLIYLTSRGDYDTSDRYFDKEHFETNQKSLRFKSYGSNSGFRVFGDLDL